MTNFSSNGRVFTHEKKSNNFTHKQTFLFSPGSDELQIYCQSCGTNIVLKSQPKLSRHSEEHLVKTSDQNTQGIKRSKSQTESEQNWFSKIKTSWLFSPVCSFSDWFMDVPPYQGANILWKYLCEFFQRNTDPK